jgi:hypothetical protein
VAAVVATKVRLGVGTLPSRSGLPGHRHTRQRALHTEPSRCRRTRPRLRHRDQVLELAAGLFANDRAREGLTALRRPSAGAPCASNRPRSAAAQHDPTPRAGVLDRADASDRWSLGDLYLGHEGVAVVGSERERRHLRAQERMDCPGRCRRPGREQEQRAENLQPLAAAVVKFWSSSRDCQAQPKSAPVSAVEKCTTWGRVGGGAACSEGVGGAPVASTFAAGSR